MNRSFLLLLALIFPQFSVAATTFELHLKNDSLNGFKFSDAYETSNFGLTVTRKNNYMHAYFAILSPKMSKNTRSEWRPNRSYAEVLTSELGLLSKNSTIFIRNFTIGNFNLLNLQDQIHSILQQPSSADELSQIRSKKATYWGLGYKMSFWRARKYSIEQSVYAGEAQKWIGLKLQRELNFRATQPKINFGIDYYFQDQFPELKPIVGKHRKFRPYLLTEFNVGITKLPIVITHKFSLPTLASDDEIFIQLGLNYKFAVQ